jgi:hypothetical protein
VRLQGYDREVKAGGLKPGGFILDRQGRRVRAGERYTQAGHVVALEVGSRGEGRRVKRRGSRREEERRITRDAPVFPQPRRGLR